MSTPKKIWLSEADSELERIVKEIKIKIKVLGCGGGGCNSINRIVDIGMENVEVIACNTDAKQLLRINAHQKILLGRTVTRGLGTGGRPDMGLEAAYESEDEVRKALMHTDILFLVAALGGGTGSGAAPYIARIGRSSASLIIGVVTLPFEAEGKMRRENAHIALSKLRSVCDTTIVIPNDRLLQIAPNLPLDGAFRMADEVLVRAVQGIVEIVTKPGLVNLDFSDLLSVMKGGGMAMLALGESDLRRRLVSNAVNEALSSPLLYADLESANRAVVYVMGGEEMSIKEAEEAVELISKRINTHARIIWGCRIEPELKNTIRLMLILTGMKTAYPESYERERMDDIGLDFVD